jgi:hypothetical protein
VKEAEDGARPPQDFPSGFKGHWSLKYVDEDMRCFSTNKGNVFVLQRVDE